MKKFAGTICMHPSHRSPCPCSLKDLELIKKLLGFVKRYHHDYRMAQKLKYKYEPSRHKVLCLVCPIIKKVERHLKQTGAE